MTTAEKLVRLRKEKGLSQLQLAEEINVSRQAISRWEVGLAVPSREKLRALSELYNVSVDYLLSDKTAEDMQKVSKTEDEAKEKPKPNEAQKNAANDLREQAKFLYNSNKLNESLELFSKIPDAEKISDDWLFLANIAQDNNKEIDAVFFLKKAIQADDKNYKAHYNLGNIYFSDNKINMALNEYRKVLRIKKDYAYAYYNKGCCYLKKKSWYNARYEFGLAIKANPEEPAFYYNLAYTYKMLKKPKKAQEALDMYNKLMTQ